MTGTSSYPVSVDECRRLIKRIDDLLHESDSVEAHKELHELAHLFEQVVGVAQGAWQPVAQVPARGTDDAMLLYFPPSVTGAHKQSTLPAMYRTGHPDDFPNRKPSHFMLVGAPSIPSTNRRSYSNCDLVNCGDCDCPEVSSTDKSGAA